MLSSMMIRLSSAAGVLLASQQAWAAPTAVAVSGTAAPAGGTYSTFSNAVINSQGQVAFTANLSNGTSTSGLFTGLTGAVQAVALQGTAAPGGGTFGTISLPPVLNGSGQIAFNASLTTGASVAQGVFTGTPGSLSAVALQGTAAPSGGNFNAFATTSAGAAASPVLNASGQVAFQSTLTGGTSAAGIFYGSAGSLQTGALVGQPAPGGIGNYTTTVTAPAFNANGQIAFVSLIGSTPGIFAGTPGALQTVAFGAAPNGVGNYGSPTSTSYNNAGQVAFTTTLTGGTATAGVFAGAPGAVQAVALQGTSAAGGSGGNYSSFSNANINGAGQVSFGSVLSGGTAASGLFQSTGGVVQAVALVGGAAPNGTTYASFASAQIQNGVGQVAFVANLSGTGVVTGTNSAALFAGLPGELQEVLRQGDLIDVDPTAGIDLRTVTGSISLIINGGGQDGRGISFNDNGQLVYRLSFTDGSTGVFISAVPEPTSVAALAVAGAGLRRRRQRVVNVSTARA